MPATTNHSQFCKGAGVVKYRVCSICCAAKICFASASIFNLFTSFGYFENESDNQKTLISIKESLSDYGFAVIDFMNVNNVIANLIANEIKVVDGIEFNITRFVSEDNFIIKEIKFVDNGENFYFTEKVKAFTLSDFETMMTAAEINLLDTFGDYKLKKFHKKDSERLIMIFK